MTPLVSIIIPCYNTEKFISKALTSIQNQSYQNIEVIIIDDGSTDNSVIICENFIQTDKRFSLLKSKNNKGVAYSLNKGIENSRGKYIARMDADDISYPDRIKVQTQFLEKNEDIDIVGVNAYLLKTCNENKINSNPIYFETNTLNFCTYFSQPFFGGCILGKSKVFTQIKFKSGYVSEDFEFVLNAIHLKYKLANINEGLYGYRTNLSSISNTNNSGQIDSHNKTSQYFLEKLHQKKLDKKIIEIVNNRPSSLTDFREYKKALELFSSTAYKLNLKRTREIRIYQIRQKIDIGIQSIKQSKSLNDKLCILCHLISISLNVTGIIYLLRK